MRLIPSKCVTLYFLSSRKGINKKVGGGTYREGLGLQIGLIGSLVAGGGRPSLPSLLLACSFSLICMQMRLGRRLRASTALSHSVDHRQGMIWGRAGLMILTHLVGEEVL